jgi:hypothetical protein
MRADDEVEDTRSMWAFGSQDMEGSRVKFLTENADRVSHPVHDY